MDSCHPKYCKVSITFSQALRLRRIFSEHRTYIQRTRELKQYFLSRGYHEQHLENEFKRALGTSREACLQLKSNQEKCTHIPLVVTSSYFTIFSFDHWMPSPDPSCLGAITKGIRASTSNCLRRPKNLRDLLVRVTLTATTHESPGPCCVSEWNTCPILMVTDEV